MQAWYVVNRQAESTRARERVLEDRGPHATLIHRTHTHATVLVCDQASLFQSQDERAQKRAQQQAKQAAQKAFLGNAPAVLTHRHIHMARLMRGWQSLPSLIRGTNSP